MIGFKTFGSGPRKALVLHGWFGDENSFDPLLKALSPDEFTYAFIAYRGYGLSRDIEGVFDIAEASQDALALTAHLGWSRFSLIGHSMGGMVAQRVLADDAGRVDKLIGVTPVPACGVPFDDATWSLFDEAANSDENRRTIIDYSTGNRLPKAWIKGVADNSRRTSSQKAFRAYLASWARTDFHQEIVGNTVPLKVIVGAHDPSITADVMQATFLKWFPNSSLEVMKNVGHYPMDEMPISLASSIEGFLRSA